MKSFHALLGLQFLLIAPTALAVDPISDFKMGLTIPGGDKILKWQADVDGDGKNEVFLSLKSYRDKDDSDHQTPGWTLYMPQTSSSYTASKGISEKADEVTGSLPEIDTNQCYVGFISEIGKNGILSIRYLDSKQGSTTAIIYVYVIESDHLKIYELARYEDSETPHALFSKYLTESKRTHIDLAEIDP